MLSYTFCSGGLTPYMIDETFAADAETEEGLATTSGLATWQVLLDDTWLNYPEPVQAALHRNRAVAGSLRFSGVQGCGV